MAILKHEIWIDADGLEMCCLAGVVGNAARSLLGSGARLVHTFEAGSHSEAMTIYNWYLGREPYATTEQWDTTAYPDEWLRRQGTSD